MYRKVKEYIREYRMIEPGDRVIAGISGGPDSVAMLHLLHEYMEEEEFTMEAVHVNHGLRGEEAKRDQEFVEKLCGELGIGCRVFCFSVPELAEQWKIGHEEAGRRVRREAFQRVSSEYGGRRVRIALAHNQNDRAETMLHHLARGTGIRGLAGIRPVWGNIIRPVLCLEREEIDHYLKERCLRAVEDSSNLEDIYTRNRIRHHILPLMVSEINGKALEHMAAAADILGRAEDYLSRQGAELLEECRRERDSFLFSEKFFQSDSIVREYAVMQAVEALSGSRCDLSAVHVKQIMELEKGKIGSRIDLPFGLAAGREYGGVRLGRASARYSTGENLAEKSWELPAEGQLSCPLGCFRTRVFCYQGEKISEKKYTKWLDYDKINYQISVRTRRTGDFLAINSAGQKKKLNRCFIDQKVPREERERIPLVACGGEVLWILGGRINDAYKIGRSTKRVLEIIYQGGYDSE